MEITSGIATLDDPGEAIQVELPVKARNLALFEPIFGQHGLDEALGVVHPEGTAMGEPGDDVGIGLVQHLVNLEGELGLFRTALSLDKPPGSTATSLLPRSSSTTSFGWCH